MATATQKDDDLLIITEDDSTSSDSSEIDFSFDAPEDNSDASIETAILEESSPENTQETTATLDEKTTSEAENVTSQKTEDNTPDESVGFDLGIDVAKETETSPKVEGPSEVSENKSEADFSFNLGGDTSEASSDAQATLSPDNSESLNDILAGTIAKLESRKETIATEKSSKAQKEDALKEKIKDLQAEVKELEADMKALDGESDKIVANIVELEKMKLDPVKEHNARRTVKK